MRTQVLALALVAALFLFPASAQEPAEQCFPETGKCIKGSFLTYWRANGALRQQGLPITNEMQETQAPPPTGDGKTYTVQYFERSRFEHHPEFSGTPNEVLLGLLGREQYTAKYETPKPQDPFTIKGSTAQNTPLFALTGGTYRVNWSATNPSKGTCYHGGTVNSPEQSYYVERITNETVDANQTKSAETYLYGIKPGKYYLAVTGDCTWSFTLTHQP